MKSNYCIAKFIFTCLLLIISYAAPTNAQDTNDIVIGTKHTIYSEILGEERTVKIHLPFRYDENKEYPIVYLLDGEVTFNFVSAVSDILPFAGEMPYSIIVAINNTNRARDLTPTPSDNGLEGAWVEEFKNNSGGAGNFLKFITDELIPDIESKYRTNQKRLLLGHSNAGMFTLYAFLQRSDVFEYYVSVDPSVVWGNEVLLKMLKDKVKTPLTTKASIYIAAANNQNDENLKHDSFHKAQINFVEALSTWDTDNLRVNMTYYDKEDHLTVVFQGTRQGLKFVFDEQEKNEQ